MIYVCPLSHVETNVARLKPSHLISLLDPQHPIPTPKGVDPDRHLFVGINDIASRQDGYQAPEEAHVADLVAFLSTWTADAPILIHCWAGISRSTATAFIALCLRHDGRELEAALALRDASRFAQPNRRLVALADKILGRSGRMVQAIAAMGPADFTAEGETFKIDPNAKEFFL